MTRNGDSNGYNPDRDFADDQTQYLGPTAGSNNAGGEGETRYQPAQPTQYGPSVSSQGSENTPRQYFPGEAGATGYQPQQSYYQQPPQGTSTAPATSSGGGGGNGLLTAVAVLSLIAAVVFFVLWLTSSNGAGGADEEPTPVTETVTETSEAEPTTVTSTETITPEPETIEIPSGEDIQNRLDEFLNNFNNEAPAPEPAPAP